MCECVILLDAGYMIKVPTDLAVKRQTRSVFPAEEEPRGMSFVFVFIFVFLVPFNLCYTFSFCLFLHFLLQLFALYAERD